MPSPDTLFYYTVMIGTSVAIPILLFFLVSASVQTFRQRTARHYVFLALSGFLFLAALIANPICNCLLFVPTSNARVAALHETANREGYVGRTLTEFATRFGEPDHQRELETEDYDLFVYTCRPWFAYGWDELVVSSRDNVVLGIHIDD